MYTIYNNLCYDTNNNQLIGFYKSQSLLNFRH